jgi:hypothetical protein
MCNPRRIHIRLAEEIREAWRHEIARTVSLQGTARGEARIRRDLSTSLNAATLAAVARAMAEADSGWRREGNRWRAGFEGGYCLFDPDDLTFDIVAVREAAVSVVGEARDTIEGELTAALETEQGVDYWDDGYAGRDEAWAKREADARARSDLDRQRQERIARLQAEAEAERGDRLAEAAREAGGARLAEAEAARRAQLERDAAAGLEIVSQRAMARLGPMLARGIRDTMRAYAEQNGGSDWQCEEQGGVIDISFSLAH